MASAKTAEAKASELKEVNIDRSTLGGCTTSNDWITNLIQLYRETYDEDLTYLNAHPEIQEIIEMLVEAIEKNKPQNVHQFVALYFQHNRHRIQLKTTRDRSQK